MCSFIIHEMKMNLLFKLLTFIISFMIIFIIILVSSKINGVLGFILSLEVKMIKVNLVFVKILYSYVRNSLSFFIMGSFIKFNRDLYFSLCFVRIFIKIY